MDSESLLYGGVVVNNSITNPAVVEQDTQDKNEPFSFFDFLKHSDSTATPQQFNVAFQDYLLIWHEIKVGVGGASTKEIKAQYIALLKDIALNFTTQDEKRFLANIDFNNDSDLAIVVPFYSRKIKEICDFFASKREDVKHQAEKVKIKGTARSFEKFIFDVVIDFLFTDDSSESYRTTNIALTSIAASLDIEIESLFDTYGEYFDIDPSAEPSLYDVKNAVREKYFTANTNEIDTDLYLDFNAQLKEEIFGVPVFLREIGPKISFTLDPTLLDLECDPSNPFAKLLEERKKPANEKLRLQQALIEKYIGTDFYYLSTGNSITESTSGVLFEAAEPAKNLLNRRFPTTASVKDSQVEVARRMGLFFKPDKLGVLYFYSPSHEYRINTDALEANKVYIFPDPEKYGNVTQAGGLTYDHPLVFTVDNSTNIKNRSTGFAFGDINKDPRDQTFHGYYSRIYDIDTNTINISALNNNFNSLYNKGVVTEWKTDIWGNQYGLFKDKNGGKSVIEDISDQKITCTILDGHEFYDQNEGYGFDYSTFGSLAYNDAIRTGLSAKTVDNIPFSGGNYLSGYNPFTLSAGMIFLSGNPTFLYFREFTPYEVCEGSERVINCTQYDGGKFTFPNNTALPDAISSDSSLWPGAGAYYYTILVDSGVNALSPVTRATTDGFAADFTLNASLALSSTDITLYDSGFFTDICELDNDYSYSRTSPFYIDTVSGTSLLNTATATRDFTTIAETRSLTGQLFFKDIVTNQVQPASAALEKIISKQPTPIKNELNEYIYDIDVVYDTIMFKTSSYFVVDQLLYEDGSIINPGTVSTYLALTAEKAYQKVTNPFFVEDKRAVFYARTRILPALSSTNCKTIYFDLYRYDIKEHVNKKLYPKASTTVDTLTGIFKLYDATDSQALSSNIVRIGDPRLSYSSRNDKFALTFVAEDSNNTPYIISHTFSLRGDDITISSNTIYKPDTVSFTHNFNTLSGSWADVATELGSPAWETETGLYDFSSS